jgi:hypothetical protein
MAFNGKRAALATRPSLDNFSNHNSAGTFKAKSPKHQDRIAVKCHPGAKTARRRPQIIFVLRLTPLAGVDAIRALRALLKTALRRFGLRCVSVRDDDEGAT